MFGTKIIPNEPLNAPYIEVDVITNHSIKKCKSEKKYVVAPSAKKIATYIVNQIFGSELITQTEGLSINWLMPTLKEALELGVYQNESFVYIHKFDNKIYLECIKKSDIHELVQKFDKVMSCSIVQEFEGTNGEIYYLKRDIKIDKENDSEISYIKMSAYKKSKDEKINVPIKTFNKYTGNDYMEKYILPYAVVINIDLGTDFFKDSEKFLISEMKTFNVMIDEIEKTRTRIATTQHYQTTDITMGWKPNSSTYNVGQLSIGELEDYFTLLPGDREHAIFEFLQGNVRTAEYVNTFKFYDQQIIQMAGLSPASFGYEKDAYMNTDNVNLSKNNSDMTVEAIKTQIEPQINRLIENIVRAQQSEGIVENVIPTELSWDYGVNEKYDDMKKLTVLGKINSVASVPYNTRAKIITPILNKLIGEVNEKDLKEIIDQHNEEENAMRVEYGEI